MTVNIEKMRVDMATQQRKLELETRWETRKFVVSIVVAIAAALGAGAAIGNYLGRQAQPPQTIIIQQQPGPPTASK